MIDIRYGAGLFDGEGCVYVGRVTNNKKALKLRASIVMTTKAPLLAFSRRFGGSVHLHKEKTKTWKTSWRWSLQGKAALDFLEQIYPYSLVKKPIIRVARAWGNLERNFCRYRPIPAKELLKRDQLVLRARRLNFRGSMEAEE
jgi:hypothetical protein